MAPKVSTLPMLIHKEFANLKFSLYASNSKLSLQKRHKSKKLLFKILKIYDAVRDEGKSGRNFI
ncbi:hypothetical protein T09_13822 [Trichinella sp. T9]|nr:hypothetical protein T09_13822 [Trichinella sp. T9]